MIAIFSKRDTLKGFYLSVPFKLVSGCESVRGVRFSGVIDFNDGWDTCINKSKAFYYLKRRQPEIFKFKRI